TARGRASMRGGSCPTGRGTTASTRGVDRDPRPVAPLPRTVDRDPRPVDGLGLGLSSAHRMPESDDPNLPPAIATSAVARTLSMQTQVDETVRTRTRFASSSGDALADGPSAPPLPGVGDTVGNYVLRQKLGEGAHGSVFRAHRVGLEEQRVALKLIPCTR